MLTILCVALVFFPTLAYWIYSPIRQFVREARRPLPAPDRFAALEAAHAAECLDALTTADIEWLKWWSWTPPESVKKRLRDEAEQARFEAMSEEEQEAHIERSLMVASFGYSADVYIPHRPVRTPAVGDEVMTRSGPVTFGVRAATPEELRFDPYADGTLLRRPMSLVSSDGFV